MKTFSLSKRQNGKRPFQKQGTPLSAILGKIMTPLCQRQGLITADLVLEWPRIVGEEMAQVCQVMKISFPSYSRQQGCLHLQTSSAMAMALTYTQSNIIERVNQYYGYQAIDKIRIFHKPFAPTLDLKIPLKEETTTIPSEWQALAQTINDEDLQQALINFGHSLQIPQKTV